MFILRLSTSIGDWIGCSNKRVRFTKKEVSFLLQNEICRVATSYNNIPHVVPVNYIYENSFLYFATDYSTRKYRNLQKNKKIALTIDVYNSSLNNIAVIIQGLSELIERGEEFKRLYKIFERKFEWVRNDPWQEGEAPFIKVHPVNKVSWGL
ncbi:MAG TPA: pyridoxamine 5'-phosphate oxidase family protein [Candidatus Bathyarchaeia archaeon]|nr:pyridoxamine 5'-phosphate oxidase family protein [Candidatus Bathyarchaeia archaeon]